MIEKWFFIFIFSFLALNLPEQKLGFASEDAHQRDWGIWQEARKDYDSGNYEQALFAFQTHPADDANYHYNLGTLYYRMIRYGHALAHLEKANLLQPHDSDIQYNLSQVQSKLGQILGVENLDPASSWLEKLSDRLSLQEIRTALGLLGIILVMTWLHGYRKVKDLTKTLLRPAALISLAAFSTTASIYGLQRFTATASPSYCTSSQVVRSGPGEHFLELARLKEGMKLRLLSQSVSAQGHLELWSQVRYSQDGIGWVKASGLLSL